MKKQNLVVVGARVRPEALRALRRLADQRGITVSELLADLIRREVVFAAGRARSAGSVAGLSEGGGARGGSRLTSGFNEG